ncbi:uncharacterized protein BXZ73DRAFT_91887 [Epithele typhae]|uniref:uncharacterized protein n=1 Tax=Epithele typhae TaxID=378194 RepID=UPI002008A0B9|nr:uncharacterized protein BXZ73DRAFT_91887 [Epithele typhae]KAH9920876.1 hypothetical protein BXZ73DRAFT_91887 [Epithele typhae]
MTILLAASAVLLAAALALALALLTRMSTPPRAPRAAYILENTVAHARLLPTPSKHAFAYPTLALLLSLDALESPARDLDLARGWLFGYGGTAWRVAGLRPAAYLLPDGDSGTKSVKAKLGEVLGRDGQDAARLGRVWMLTMPSYLGYEGINPLTVHYCYGRREEGEEEELAWVVLEIHNTFGEKHVHVLRTGEREDDASVRPPGYDHQWTFARDFHVSPFNDRLGHYTVAIRIHLHAHASSQASSEDEPSPPPSHPAAALGPLKLTATQIARRAVPLTPAHLLAALAAHPFALFLSFARILYHAWVLHYRKHLDVFPRPDPLPAVPGWGSAATETCTSTTTTPTPTPHGGVGWQPEGALEAYARGVTSRFLARRSAELGVRVALVSADPSVPALSFAPRSRAKHAPSERDDPAVDAEDGSVELVVHYGAPRFFTTLLAAPSAEHALRIGRLEDLFRVASAGEGDGEALFLRVFAGPQKRGPEALSSTQRLRTALLPAAFVRGGPSSTRAVPSRHALDGRENSVVGNALAVLLVHALDGLERLVFAAVRARFVPGLEPWNRWARAGAVIAASE